MYPVPSRCAFAFAGESAARHSQCWRFRGLLVHHCYDLLSCSPPLQETFTSGLSTARSPSPLPDITTVATGQFPPSGLAPAGPTTSVAAQLTPPHSIPSWTLMRRRYQISRAALRQMLRHTRARPPGPLRVNYGRSTAFKFTAVVPSQSCRGCCAAVEGKRVPLTVLSRCNRT